MNQLIHQFKAEFFKTLAHPVRLAILEYLRSGEHSVNEIQTLLDADQSTISQQLGRLRSADVVVTRKEGTTVYYRVRDERIFALMNIAREIFDDHLANRREVLSQMQETNTGS